VSVAQAVAGKTVERVYTFDKACAACKRSRQSTRCEEMTAELLSVPPARQVFGPAVTQKEFYDDAIQPIVDEVRES